MSRPLMMSRTESSSMCEGRGPAGQGFPENKCDDETDKCDQYVKVLEAEGIKLTAEETEELLKDRKED